MANAGRVKELAKVALDNGAVELVVYKDMPRTSCLASEFMEKYEEMEDKHLISEYLLDGVIYDVVNEDIKQLMGATNHHPIWRLAKKRVKGAKPTKTLNIRWQVSRTLKINPVLEVEAVELSGVMVTSITGHNYGFLLKNQLGVGSVILAHRAGSVIPAYLETISPAEVDYPKQCPCCESETYIRMGVTKDKIPTEFLMCPNKDCGGSKVTSLFHAFKRLSIAEFGHKSLIKLVDSGKDSLKKIMMMNVQDFIGVGFGDGESAIFVKEIKKGIETPLKDSHFLSALGVRLLGRTKSELVLNEIKITELDDLTYDMLFVLPNFGDITCKSILNGLTETKSTLEFLLSQNFNLIHTSESKVIIEEGNGLNGLAVVFTGTMEQGNRTDMETQAKLKGATVQKKVSGKKTNLLVCGAKTGKSKVDAAIAFGIEVIDEQTYIDRFCS